MAKSVVGSLWINVKANTGGLSKGLGKSRGMLSKFGKFAVSPAGLAVVAFAGLTAGIMATTKVISASIKEFMEFDKAMSEVKSVLLDLSGNQFDALTNKAKQLGATTAHTATEIAGAMANLARAGFKEGDGFTQIQDAIKSVSDLANATGMEMAEASDIIAVGVKAFGLEASEATRVADVLALTASKTNTTVTQLGEGMKYVAPVAKQLGFSIEEASAMLGSLANAGIKSSEGGTALRKMFLMLGKDIEQHGTQAFFDFMSVQQGVTTNFDKFGARAVTGAGVLQDMSDSTANLTEELMGATGAVDKMASRQLDNLAGDVTLFESAVSGLKIALGDELDPVFREIVQVATTFIVGLQGMFQHLMKGMKDTGKNGIDIAGIFKAVGAVLVMTGTFAFKLFEQMRFGFNTIQTVAGAVLTGVSAIIQAIVEAASWGLNAVGLMSDSTYDATVGFMRDLTTELASMTADNAVEAGGAFVNGFVGGAEAKGNSAFEAFSNAMDNGLPIEEFEKKGEDLGEAIVSGMAEPLSEGEKVTIALLETTEKLSEKLTKQIAEFGKTKGEVLALQLAEEGLSGATIDNILAMEEQLVAMKKTQSEQDKLATEAQKVIESLRTPQEVYDDEVANLQKMVDAKVLTLEQFQKAVDKLKVGTEEDIEVNILSKGIVESLDSALGSIKIGVGDSPMQVAKQALDVQRNMRSLTTAIAVSVKETSRNLSSPLDVVGMEDTKEEVEKLGGINNSGFESVREAIKELGIGGAIAVLT